MIILGVDQWSGCK